MIAFDQAIMALLETLRLHSEERGRRRKKRKMLPLKVQRLFLSITHTAPPQLFGQGKRLKCECVISQSLMRITEISQSTVFVYPRNNKCVRISPLSKCPHGNVMISSNISFAMSDV